MYKEKLNRINKILLFALILIQPIFNIIRENIINDIQIFGLSFFEIFNTILILISFSLTFILNYKNKNFLYTIFTFFSIFIIYLIFHAWNVLNFNLNAYENAAPSFLRESYYLCITFAVPVLYCILLIYSKLTKNDILKLIKVFIFIIVNVIVITNILSMASTAYETNLENAYSIFKWFDFDNESFYSYYYLTSKGLFQSANQLSAILFMISPIIMYSAYESNKKIDYYLLFMISLSMLMIGTKTASIGILLIYSMFILSWLIYKLLKKEKKSIKLILILFIITGLLFCYSPFSYNLRYRLNGKVPISGIENIENKNENITEEEQEMLNKYNNIKYISCESLDVTSKFEVKKFIEENIKLLGIPSYIYENYSIHKHIDFWCKYISEIKSNNYRLLKTNILKNIYTDNNNKYDKYLGMGHTINYIYTESDYTYQFYHYGVLGIIVLFGVYIYYIILYLINMFLNSKIELSFKNVISISGPILVFGVAYFSGHVFERIFPLLVLSLLIAYNIVEQEDKKNNRVLFISSTGGHLSELFQLKPLFSKYDSYLITEKTKSTKSLKDEYKNISFLIYGTKDHLHTYIFKFIINCFISLYLYLKIHPQVIITTGTHTAVPMCYIAKIFGSKIIYIETFANSKTKTLTGRLVYPIADTFIVQWKSMIKLYPKATYGGWIY